jgi:predicted methyltransferase
MEWKFGECASKSNISIIKKSQSKILRMIANAPWYVPNITLHEDLNVPVVKGVIKQQQNRTACKHTDSTVARTTQ